MRPEAPPEARRGRVALVMALTAGPLLYTSLMVERAWPLAFVALVPWVLAVLLAPRLGPLVGFVALMPAYAAMHPVIGRMSALFHPVSLLYFGPPLVCTGWIVRTLARRTALPLALVVAPLWAAGERLRAGEVMPPWHSLAGAMHARLWALQVCDLAGVAGLSLALAMASGAVAGALLGRFFPEVRPRQPSAWRELGVAACAWLAVAGYGAYRLDEAKRVVREGPWVTVVQTDDFADEAAPRPAHLRLRELFARTRAEVARGPRPELVVWPELALDVSIEPTFLAAETVARLQAEQAAGRALLGRMTRFVDELGVPMLVGGPAVAWRGGRWRRHNAAYLLRPGSPAPVARHDKTRPFPMFESAPFAGARPPWTRWLHDRLGRLRDARTDWPARIDAGAGVTRFELDGVGFVAPICFENEFEDFGFQAGLHPSGRVSFWAHPASDAWGERSDDTIQAFRFGIFRAVEGRVTVARAGNGGVTGFVGPTGELYGVVGGPRAALMPAPGRPERSAIEALGALHTQREALDRELAQTPDGPAAARLRAALDANLATAGATRQRARALAAGAGHVGVSTRRVRIDARRSPYVRSRGASDTALEALWWIALTACALERIRAKVGSRAG